MDTAKKTTAKEEKKKSLSEKIILIQEKFTSKKENYNRFGKFNYRKLEDMLSNLKPLLIENRLLMTMSDEVFSESGTLFLNTTIKIKDTENNESIEIKSPCAIDLNHTGMSREQCMGSTLSYSRKYALCSLFLVDDARDPDEMENKNIEERVKECKSIKDLKTLWEKLQIDEKTDYVTALFSDRKSEIEK